MRKGGGGAGGGKGQRQEEVDVEKAGGKGQRQEEASPALVLVLPSSSYYARHPLHFCVAMP